MCKIKTHLASILLLLLPSLFDGFVFAHQIPSSKNSDDLIFVHTVSYIHSMPLLGTNKKRMKFA